jgi:hypothetical protein
LAAALKITTESIVESNISIYELHFNQREGFYYIISGTGLFWTRDNDQVKKIPG